jgi:hypothetical protein
MVCGAWSLNLMSLNVSVLRALAATAGVAKW